MAMSGEQLFRLGKVEDFEFEWLSFSKAYALKLKSFSSFRKLLSIIRSYTEILRAVSRFHRTRKLRSSATADS